MPEEKDDELTESAKQLYRKTRVPHKFCPYCGFRNEAHAEICEQCEKDISWLRIPEPIPYEETPKQPARSMPDQQKVFTPRAIVVMLIILALIAALVLILVFATAKKSSSESLQIESVRMVCVQVSSEQTASPMRSLPNLQPLRAL